MNEIHIKPATVSDKEALADLFYAHLSENVEYIYNRKNEMCRVGKRNAMVLVENEM